MGDTIAVLHRPRRLSPTVPTLPAGMPYLISALADDDIDLGKLARVIGRFPGIAARLLALANSAWAAPSRPVTSLAATCAVLGLRVVRSVSIALSVAHPFDPRRCSGFDPVRYLQSAFLASEGAPLLAPHVGDACDAGTLSTAGLLHSVGLLWLAHDWPAPTAAALQAAASDSQPGLAEALRATVGIDHCEAGGRLGEAWQFPEALTTAVRQHRSTGFRGHHWRLAAGCGVCAGMAAALARGEEWAPDGEMPLKIPPARVEEVYARLAARSDAVRELARSLFASHPA